MVPNQFETRFRNYVIEPILPYVPAAVHPNVLTMTSTLVVCLLVLLGLTAQVLWTGGGVFDPQRWV
jgi:hypothetical protein